MNFTYTISWTSAEREICVRVASAAIFRQKSVRVEIFGVREVLRITVHYKYVESHCAPCRDSFSA
jgi:hypothetical protein